MTDNLYLEDLGEMEAESPEYEEYKEGEEKVRTRSDLSKADGNLCLAI